MNYLESKMELKNFYSSVKKNMDYLDKSLNIKGCVMVFEDSLYDRTMYYS